MLSDLGHLAMRAQRGDELEERIVFAVRGIPVARRGGVSAAQPRLQTGQNLRLIAAFEIDGPRRMILNRDTNSAARFDPW